MLESLASSAPCRFRWAHKEAEGPGPSRNLGVAMSEGEIVAFMDSDCFATPEWVRHGVAAFAPGVGIVQGRTVPDPDEPLGVFRWYLRVEQESFVYETANIFYRRGPFLESGGFGRDLTPHADTPTGGEDVAVAWRVKRRGWHSRFCPKALVYHEVVPLSVWNWIVIKRLYVFPCLIQEFPELRRFMYGSYFLDRGQALFALAGAGLTGSLLHPGLLVLALPYLAVRITEPSGTLRGPARLIRVGAYFLRDAASFLLLLAGSIRYRTVLF
jgi:glycosyltransferase involved in cell wall biosynthesis